MAVNGSGGSGARGVRAGSAFVEAWLDSTKFLGGLKTARQAFTGTLAGMRQAASASGRSLSGGLVGGLTGGLAALGADRLLGKAGGLAGGAIQSAEEVSKLASRLGVGTDKLSAFAYAAGQFRQSLGDIDGHFENLQERVHQFATTGTGEAEKTFKALGLTGQQLLAANPVEQMIMIADAMKSVGNESTRLGMLSSLGGDKFQGLNDLFKQGGPAIRRYMTEAGAVGAVLSTEAAAGAAAATRGLNQLHTAVEGVTRSVVVGLLPNAESFKGLASITTQGAKAAREWLAEHRELVLGALAGTAAVAGLAGGLTMLGLGMSVAATAAGGLLAPLSLVGSGLGLVGSAALSPVGLATIGTLAAASAAGVLDLGAAFGSAGRYAREAGQSVSGWLVTGRAAVTAYAAEVKGTLSAAWAGISAAVKSGDADGAYRIAAAGVEVEFTRAADRVKQAWRGVAADFRAEWEKATAALRRNFDQLQDDIRTGVIEALGRTKIVTDEFKRSSLAPPKGGYIDQLVNGDRSNAPTPAQAVESVQDGIADAAAGAVDYASPEARAARGKARAAAFSEATDRADAVRSAGLIRAAFVKAREDADLAAKQAGLAALSDAAMRKQEQAGMRVGGGSILSAGVSAIAAAARKASANGANTTPQGVAARGGFGQHLALQLGAISVQDRHLKVQEREAADVSRLVTLVDRLLDRRPGGVLS